MIPPENFSEDKVSLDYTSFTKALSFFFFASGTNQHPFRCITLHFLFPQSRSFGVLIIHSIEVDISPILGLSEFPNKTPKYFVYL